MKNQNRRNIIRNRALQRVLLFLTAAAHKFVVAIEHIALDVSTES
jgi:hypothetical protein